MENKAVQLTHHPNWKKLLQSAEASLGESFSFDKSPEPELARDLISDFDGRLPELLAQICALMEASLKNNLSSSVAWGELRESATLLCHLRETGTGHAADWERALGLMWDSMCGILQGSWSFYTQENSTSKSKQWKREKFAYDALLLASGRISSNDEDRLERFFNSSISDYWKSFNLRWDVLWGQYHSHPFAYLKGDGYRINHRIKVFELLAYRLLHSSSEYPLHPDKVKEAYGEINQYAGEIPPDNSLREKIYAGLFDYLIAKGNSDGLIDAFEKISSILGQKEALRHLIDEKKLSIEQRGEILLGLEDELSSLWNNSRSLQRKTLPFLIAAVKHDRRSVQEDAINFLVDYEEDQFKYLHYLLSQEYETLDKETDSPPSIINSRGVIRRMARVFGDSIIQKLIDNASINQQEKGRLLLATPHNLEVVWERNSEPTHDEILPFILAAVNHRDKAVGQRASAFLKRQSAALQNKLNALINELDNSEKASELLASTIEFGNDAALKAVLQKCVVWLASNSRPGLIDSAAKKARQTPSAIPILLELLHNPQDLLRIPEVKTSIWESILSDQQNPTISRVFEDGQVTKEETNQHTLAELQRWADSFYLKSKVYADVIDNRKEGINEAEATDKPRLIIELCKAILDLLEEEKLHERETTVEKWITKIMADMSDRESNENERYGAIRNQLERLAIEPLSKRLPHEENLDIRENLVRIFGNIGGRIAVDALVRTVTGEERSRSARQELLSEYYLKPSKARSEEASLLLQDAVKNAKHTMSMLQLLNIATFGLGVILILGGVIIATVNETMGTRIVGILSGIGGLAAILTQFLKDPLERIQRAMGNLVQVQTAFTSFVWELNLNGTYIQSQYVAEGKLTDYDLRQTVQRINDATGRTVDLIQVYATGKSIDEISGSSEQPASGWERIVLNRADKEVTPPLSESPPPVEEKQVPRVDT